MALDSFQLDSHVYSELRAELPRVAAASAAAVIAEVPGYSDLQGPEGATLDQAVELALRGFLSVTSGSSSSPASPLQPALDGAYALGRGEVRSGRTMDVLLSAYRVGARAAWREWSTVAIEAGLSVEELSKFAELNFAYIDELSAASVAGFADESAALSQSRQRRLSRLARHLLSGGSVEVLEGEAAQAGWDPPEWLTAVLLPARKARGVMSAVDNRTLRLEGELPGSDLEDWTVLLVPTNGPADRERLRSAVAARQAIIGPERPWHRALSSYERAIKVLGMFGAQGTADEVTDADDYLVELVVGADPEAAAELRARLLGPLRDLRPSTAEKLETTLRAWLLHQGRRDEIAAALHIHPQTVRYRMGQLRDLYGEELSNPDTVLAATVALAAPEAPLSP